MSNHRPDPHWNEPFDLFISYARVDDRDDSGQPLGMVRAVKDFIIDQYRDEYGDELKIFFDQDAESIRDFKAWPDEIRDRVRESRMLLIISSANYLKSEWGLRELQEFVRVEQARQFPETPVGSVFLVDPAMLFEDYEDDGLIDDLDAVRELLSKQQAVDARAWWPHGPAALAANRAGCVDRLRNLNKSIHRRTTLGKLIARTPSNIVSRVAEFTGRAQQLAELKKQLDGVNAVGLTAVGGVGGIGKSTLAREYAYRNRPNYLAGRFEISLRNLWSEAEQRHATDSGEAIESHAEQILLERLAVVAESYFGLDPAVRQLPADQFAAKVKAAFTTAPREEHGRGGHVLLILDNLEEPAAVLASRGVRNRCLPAGPVHTLFTTRLPHTKLGDIKTVALHRLAPREAVDLFRKYRPFDLPLGDHPRAADFRTIDTFERPPDWLLDPDGDREEWNAALALAYRLGRHTLAVSMVAAYVREQPGRTYASMLVSLERLGLGMALETLQNDPGLQQVFETTIESFIGNLLAQTVEQLSPQAVTMLEYASLLPADRILLPWLRTLIANDPDPGAPPPEDLASDADAFERSRRELEDYNLLLGGPVARCNEVLQVAARQRMSEETHEHRERAIAELMKLRASYLDDTFAAITANADEFRAIEACVLNAGDSAERGLAMRSLVTPLLNSGRLRDAGQFAREAYRIHQQRLAADPANAAARRDLSIALERLGDICMAEGRLQDARAFFQQGLDVRRELAEADPANANARRDLSIALERLGDICMAEGRLHDAREYYEEELAIATILRDVDPTNAAMRRFISVVVNKLGNVCVAEGRLQDARAFFQQGLDVRRELAEADPANANARRDLSVSLNKLGDVCKAEGRLHDARAFFEQGLDVRRELAEADAANANARRDLSIALERLGDICMAEGRLQDAREYYEEELAIATILRDVDPTNAAMRRFISVVVNKLGNVCVAEGRLQDARAFFQQGLDVRRELAEADPANANARRDLSVSLERLGDVYVTEGRLHDARVFFQQGLDVRRELAKADPGNAIAQADLVVSLVRMALTSASDGDQPASCAAVREATAIVNRLDQQGRLNAQQAEWPAMFRQMASEWGCD